jgi:hypothetical protein
MTLEYDRDREVAVLKAESTMTVQTPACQRNHCRVAGPFDGRRIGAIETSIQLFDLSCGGAFVNSMHEQQQGVTLVLQIDLPYEGWITVKARTLYSRAGGFAVRFIDVSPDAAGRLERALRAIEDGTPPEG